MRFAALRRHIFFIARLKSMSGIQMLGKHLSPKERTCLVDVTHSEEGNSRASAYFGVSENQHVKRFASLIQIVLPEEISKGRQDSPRPAPIY